MDDLIKRSDAIEAVWKPQVKPNELIFDALKTAIESEINNVPSVDRPSATEIMNAYHEGVRKGIAEAYEADRLQGWMTVIRDAFCSDCKGYRHGNCEYRGSCYTMRVLDEIERRQHERGLNKEERCDKGD